MQWIYSISFNLVTNKTQKQSSLPIVRLDTDLLKLWIIHGEKQMYSRPDFKDLDLK